MSLFSYFSRSTLTDSNIGFGMKGCEMKGFEMKSLGAVAGVVVLGAVTVSGCQKLPEYGYIEGQTMGTSYHIRFELPEGVTAEEIQARVDERLVAINDSMSTYQDDSTISKFNRLGANMPMPIDADFIKVMQDSRVIYTQSGGAFDPTVLPLVELWGFGSEMTVERIQNPPTPEEIATAKELIDFDAIELNDDTLSKTKDGVSLDFSAIAKGYGVDVIAQVLHADYQISNYMVEIGGEVATSGMNEKQRAWQIAIDAPILNSTVSQRETMAGILQPLDDAQQGSMHIATSGNYRNSMVYEGERYSHTIDPTTGMPIVGGAPSVTVAAPSVSLADGWATALTAMPYEQAWEVANTHDIAAMFIIHRADSDPSQPSHELSDWEIKETPKMKAFRAGEQL